MTYIKINDTLYPATVSGRTADTDSLILDSLMIGSVLN